MTSLIGLLDRNLGRCPRCMRKALLSAVAAWILAGAAIAVGGRAQSLVVTAGALALTALWLAHVCVFALRATKNRAAQMAAHAPSGTAAHDAGDRLSSRRSFIIDFAATLAFTAAATIVPRRANAQTACGCRVGDICCNATTQVTYKCETISGCTQWIETGNACTPTQQNQC